MKRRRQSKYSCTADSVRELLYGGHEKDRQFQAILREAVETVRTWWSETCSHCQVFSREYSLKVPERNPKRSREEKLLLEEAFHYGLCMYIHGLERGSFFPDQKAEKETRASFDLIRKISSRQVSDTLKRQWKRFQKVSEEGDWDLETRAEDLLNIAFFFARLKRISFTGRATREDLFALLAGEKKDLLKELRQLLATAETDFLKNPATGPLETKRVVTDLELCTESRRVIGSLEEGLEFSIGDTLYLCTLSASRVWHWQEAAQLLACYMLLHLGKERDDAGQTPGSHKECLIRKLAFYRARFGEVESFEIARLEEDFRKLVEAMEKLECWSLRKPCKISRQTIHKQYWREEYIKGMLDIWDLTANSVLREIPLGIRRDILQMLEQEKVTHGYLLEYKTDSSHSTELCLYSEKQFKRGKDGKKITGYWMVRKQQQEQWTICVIIRSGGNRDRRTGKNGLETRDRDPGAADRRRFNFGIGGTYEYRSGWHMKLERQELARILARRLSLAPVHQFLRGNSCYQMKTDKNWLNQEEKDRIRDTKILLDMFHQPLEGCLEELVIGENFFARDPEGVIQETVMGLPVDYDRNPWLWIRDTGQAVIARECLHGGVYPEILLKLLGACAGKEIRQDEK